MTREMRSLREEIVSAFGQGMPPPEGELVLWDGFDQLEKEYALRFYSGKAWPDVLSHLRGLKDEPVFGAAYFLEELVVLSPPALAYHARGHWIGWQAGGAASFEQYEDIERAADEFLAELRRHGG